LRAVNHNTGHCYTRLQASTTVTTIAKTESSGKKYQAIVDKSHKMQVLCSFSTIAQLLMANHKLKLS